MTSRRAEHRDVEKLERISVDELAERRAKDPQLQILDVREVHEWDVAIPDTVHVPYHAVRGVPDGIDGRSEVAVICSSSAEASLPRVS